jgi:hypothetical protein
MEAMSATIVIDEKYFMDIPNIYLDILLFSFQVAEKSYAKSISNGIAFLEVDHILLDSKDCIRYLENIASSNNRNIILDQLNVLNVFLSYLKHLQPDASKTEIPTNSVRDLLRKTKYDSGESAFVIPDIEPLMPMAKWNEWQS